MRPVLWLASAALAAPLLVVSQLLAAERPPEAAMLGALSLVAAYVCGTLTWKDTR